MPGTLYLVPTPIGNLEDITLRALRILKEVDLIACEDTRHTRKLLAHYRISKPTVSYHGHNEAARSADLVGRLLRGNDVALVSDAGTPLISDPGHRLISEAIGQQIKVVPLPGPSAVITALIASGLPTDSFTFVGFLPARKSARRARLAELSRLGSTLILYEAPHRVRQTLSDIREVLGNRDCVIARELTKVHESYIRGPISDVDLDCLEERGEFVLIVGAGENKQPAATAEESNSILADVERFMENEGLDQKTALKRVARARRISKSEAYRKLVDERGSKSQE
jgi:16S rRNA (cytidine1402-2'-O)-methyltransferase